MEQSMVGKVLSRRPSCRPRSGSLHDHRFDPAVRAVEGGLHARHAGADDEDPLVYLEYDE